MNDAINKKISLILIPGILLTGLLLLVFLVLREFLFTLSWAFILAYVMWPIYRWLLIRFNGKATLSAGLLTACIAVTVLLIVFGLAAILQDESKEAYQILIDDFAEGSIHLPDFIRHIPGVGNFLQNALDRIINNKTEAATQVLGWAKQWLGQFANFVGGIGRNVVKLAVVVVTVFFCFRDGEEAIRQLRHGLIQFLGKSGNIYLQAAGNTTRAVVYGLVLAALGQGLLAGIGYAVAGVQAPVLLAVITALLAMIPMGATLVWMPIGLSLVLTNQFWPGVGLLLWGFLVVSTVDNIIRPVVISGAGRVPFLVVLFGVLGGLSAFGAIGLFLGPVILSVLLSVWQAWLKQQVIETAVENSPPEY
jgi:Ca2+-transporting ATPase